MSNVRRICGIALYDARIMIFSYKFVLISVISYIFMDDSMRTVREFAAAYHLDIVPASLPFYLADIDASNYVLLLLVLLFSDIPLKNGAQNYLFQRGRSTLCCGAGHIAALFLVGAVYVAEQFAFSVLTSLPNLTWGDWGGSIASNQALELGYSCNFAVSGEVLRLYEPMQAIGISAGLFFLTACVYALIEYVLNGVTRGKLGTIVLSVWSVVWIFLVGTPFERLRRLLSYSPQTLNDLSHFKPEEAPEKATIQLVSIAVLSAVVLILVKRRKIEMVK